ncbi:ubiquitin-like protein 3b isoform 2-T2 [Pholidichthys leucotaenia]
MTAQREIDVVHLRLILVSGKTQDFTFSPNDSATDIAKHVFENWPADWEEEQVSSPSILRLIFQGRFLHGNVTLGARVAPPTAHASVSAAGEDAPEGIPVHQEMRDNGEASKGCFVTVC